MYLAQVQLLHGGTKAFFLDFERMARMSLKDRQFRQFHC